MRIVNLACLRSDSYDVTEAIEQSPSGFGLIAALITEITEAENENDAAVYHRAR